MQTKEYSDVEKEVIEFLENLAKVEENHFLQENGDPVNLDAVKENLISFRRLLVWYLDDDPSSKNRSIEEITRMILGKTRNLVLKLVQERIDSMPDVGIT